MAITSGRPSLGNASAYQVSGWPWVTGSIMAVGKYFKEVNFPSVTKSFTVVNLDATHIHPAADQTGTKAIFIFFGDVSVADTVQPDQILNNHFITIPEDKNGFVFDVKCRKIFVGCHDIVGIGAFQIFAELTNVPAVDMPALSGNGIDD